MKICSLAFNPCIALLMLSLTVLSSALAGEKDLPQAFAQVSQLRGEVTATDKEGKLRPLNQGSTIYVGEKLRSAANGEAVLRTGDAGIVAMRPNAEFIPERFSAEGKANDHQILRLISGSLRIISGWIGQINSKDSRVITPSATIGIRGTDHEPYVLAKEMATKNTPPGSYDKVNRGGTWLEANGGNVDIDSGKVGFARDPKSIDGRTRALLTLLLPVVLDKIPDFYVPGTFDAELDRYSAQAEDSARAQLDRLGAESDKKAGEAPAASTALPTPPPPIAEGCQPTAIGRHWLAQLDNAIARRDAPAILRLFAPDIVALATVHTAEGPSTLSFSREEMARSTLASVTSLQDYRQHRASIKAALDDGETEHSCRRLNVRSQTIEQGMMNGKPFRFEALEEYRLERRGGEWLAIQARTTQR